MLKPLCPATKQPIPPHQRPKGVSAGVGCSFVVGGYGIPLTAGGGPGPNDAHRTYLTLHPLLFFPL
ncbi:hypothetical protein SAMN04488069_11447 [Hymenobacter psychrophilus]|uniref:Uncharacterized protein n=1 Tax=Hymenobacter psychrophilus TaxID=651662 RepID=A0A1H3MX61_9BACT|nr:hypothetical protein SAMN04488069_11447 [Hymenobacter psychrophilus]